jgi:toxin ParE1/3/4
MRRLRLTTSAKRDLREIAQHLRLQGISRNSIITVIDRLGAQCRTLSDLPGELGRPRPELANVMRSFPFRGYVLFFRYSDDELIVIHVLSERQDHSAQLWLDEG